MYLCFQNEFIFSEIYMKTLETERLILRGWRHDDLDDLYGIYKNPKIGLMGNWEPHSSKEASLTALNSFIEDNGRWAIVLKENEKVIGGIRIYPDENRGNFSARNSAKYINYILAEDFWGKGYMSEAVKRAVKYAFDEMSIELLTAFHHPDNIRSKRVLEKCGFEYEVTIERGIKNYDGQTFDSVCHSILKSDYYSK